MRWIVWKQVFCHAQGHFQSQIRMSLSLEETSKLAAAHLRVLLSSLASKEAFFFTVPVLFCNAQLCWAVACYYLLCIQEGKVPWLGADVNINMRWTVGMSSFCVKELTLAPLEVEMSALSRYPGLFRFSRHNFRGWGVRMGREAFRFGLNSQPVAPKALPKSGRLGTLQGKVERTLFFVRTLFPVSHSRNLTSNFQLSFFVFHPPSRVPRTFVDRPHVALS